ncbi:MAG TPA: hypothetical protein VG892_14255 [Terriglobales bacterium]|nr:hypothetical protein [Terriglobales bacterium]
MSFVSPSLASPSVRRAALAVALLAAAFTCACRKQESGREIAYVAVPQSFIRDRVAPVYKKVATVHNSDRLEVLERRRRFALVRTANGEQGWIQERYLVSEMVYEVAHKLPETARALPVQARAVTRAAVNLHIFPGRDTPHLFQLQQDEPVEIYQRTTRAKDQPAQQPAAQKEKDKEKDEDTRDEVPEPLPLPMEDWLLVRSPKGLAGWILARMVFVDIPLEIAQYAEGERIVAYFVLNEVMDSEQEKKVPQYLVLLSESKDGLPYDFDQARVFSWNLKRHRYETAYRERNLNGAFPARVAVETFEKEGSLPVFFLPVKDEQGKVSERKYKLNGPIVHRVLASGEAPSASRTQSSARARSRRR